MANKSAKIDQKADLIWAIADDQFKGQHFDYILSNPPFGREWKNEKAKVEDEAKLGFGGRFGAGLPAASDGQMLFLMTEIMAEILELEKELSGSLEEVFR